MSFFQKFKEQLSSPEISQKEEPKGGDSNLYYCKEALATLYKPETIDVRTVKVMGEEEEKGLVPIEGEVPIEKEKNVLAEIYSLEEPEEEPRAETLRTAGQDEFFDLFSKEFSEFLDLGNGFSPYLPSFKLNEPISILTLSSQAEKSLVDNGKTTLIDLAEMRRGSFKFLKGIGQGHIDEICLKTVEYLKDESLFYTQWVDFEALIRTTLSRLDALKGYLLLERYGLERLIEVSPAQMVEIKHMPPEKKREEQDEVAELLREAREAKRVRESIQKVCEVFLTPWVEKRLRMASAEEVEERLDRVSRKGEASRPYRKLLSEIFFEGEAIFSPFLKSINQQIYFDSEKVVKNFRLVIKTALSYFYAPSTFYPIDQLVAFVERELGKKWISFQEGFVRKTLIYSGEFRVCKEKSGQIRVRRW